MTNTEDFGKSKNNDIDDKLHDSMKAYLKPAYILKESDIVKVYDEEYYLIGELPIKKPEQIDPIEVKDVQKPKDQTAYIMPGLDFNLTYKGKKFASKTSGGFFFLYNELGVDIFEYFTNDLFCGFNEEKELLLFKDGKNGQIYGKGFDGRRYKISSQKVQQNHSISNSNKIPNVEQKRINKSEPKQSLDNIISLLIYSLKKIIKKNNISADFFISEKLDDPEISKIFIKVYKGDLSQLNEELKEASLKGKNVNIPSGFNSQKTALLHQLFINTTLKGRGGHRGKNMRSLLLDLIILDKYGKLMPKKKIITPKVQEKGVEFFKQLSQKYIDKRGVILRVYNSIKNDDEYIELINMDKNIDKDIFKAFLISKFYEYTTRIDRGNGITMINISKILMDI